MTELKKYYKAMKFNPNFILLKVFRRYMTPDEANIFLKKISQITKQNGKVFTNAMLKNFDIERIKKKPLIWQDIWVYNYCKYDILNGLRKTNLIKRYEIEAFIISDEEFWKAVNKKL